MESRDALDALLDQADRSRLAAQRRAYLAQIAQLTKRVEAIDAVLALRPADDDLPADLDPGVAEAIHDAERPGLAEAVLRIMRREPALAWNADAMLAHLINERWEPRGSTPKNSVAATFSRMRSERKIERIGPGLYQLAQTGQGSDPAATGDGAEQLTVGEGG